MNELFYVGFDVFMCKFFSLKYVYLILYQRLNNVSWMINCMLSGFFNSGFWDSCVKMAFWKYIFVILCLKSMKSISWSVNYVLNGFNYGVLLGFMYIDLSWVSVCYLELLVIGSWVVVSVYTQVLAYLLFYVMSGWIFFVDCNLCAGWVHMCGFLLR